MLIFVQSHCVRINFIHDYEVLTKSLNLVDIHRSKHIKGKLCEAINNLQNFQKSWKKQEVKYLQKKFKKKTAWLFLSHFQPINHASKFKKIHYYLIMHEEIKEKLTVFNVVQISQGLSFRK